MPTKKATKKTTVKATAKTTAKRTVKTQPMPVQEHVCNCAHDCPCHSCSRFKKLVILVIVFCLGFVAAKLTSCPCKKHPMLNVHPVFTEAGCLDMESIKCPKMQDALRTSEANADGCITSDEFFAMKKEMMKKHHRGPKHMEPKPETVEQPAPENM